MSQEKKKKHFNDEFDFYIHFRCSLCKTKKQSRYKKTYGIEPVTSQNKLLLSFGNESFFANHKMLIVMH